MPPVEQEIQAAIYQQEMRSTWEREDKVLRHINYCEKEADDCPICLHHLIESADNPLALF